MERVDLTPEQQSFLDGYRTQHNVQPSDPVQEGTNIVVDDHLQIDNSWNCIAVRGDGGIVDIYVPDWGDYAFTCDVVPYVTDRAGPNGQIMPILNEPEEQPPEMMVALSEGDGTPENPRKMARAERKQERSHRRDVKEMWRDALKRMPKDLRKRARADMIKAGALGPEDKDD